MPDPTSVPREQPGEQVSETQPTSPLVEALTEVEDFLDYRPGSPAPSPTVLRRQAAGPLVMVETAFLASAASLIWLVNTYFPPGPLLRVVFPLPIALIYLRWGHRAAWMGALVSGLLLAVMMGPPRSLLFLIPYGLLGVQLGWLWRRGSSWYVSIGIGSILNSLGFFVRLWLVSLMLGEDLWVYTMNQVTQLLTWGIEKLVNWGFLGFGAVGAINVTVVQVAATMMIVISSIVYLFTVHLASWFLLERLGEAMPPPPLWVRRLLDS
jgi:uncharacterized protein YybS (DUF2232 family)